MQTFNVVLDEEQVAKLRTALDLAVVARKSHNTAFISECGDMDSMFRDLKPDVLNDLTK